MRSATAIVALVLVVGCTRYENYYTWNMPPGGTQQQSDADWYRCLKENTTRGTVIDTGSALTPVTVSPTENTNDEMALQCMRAKGYTITGRDTRPVGAVSNPAAVPPRIGCVPNPNGGEICSQVR
jgi:hypothetical protein